MAGIDRLVQSVTAAGDVLDRPNGHQVPQLVISDPERIDLTRTEEGAWGRVAKTLPDQRSSD